MRVVAATKFRGAEVLVASEVAEPVAGPGQVVVDALFAPVLFLDTQIRSGRCVTGFPRWRRPTCRALGWSAR
jgi:NADPH:quinone reductase-like Zn-dependent oxidoreductase